MPLNHRYKDDWNPDKLKWWAENIGPKTLGCKFNALKNKFISNRELSCERVL
jgi:hypothetical protein